MTTDKVSGKAAALRSLLMKAWRERWSASQYGTQVKSVLGRGVSGDVFGLADSIVNQALSGPAPNQLLLSLLRHSLATQLVSHAASLAAVAKYTGLSRPHCTAALLELLDDQRCYMTSRGRQEECLLLATSMVGTVNWLMRTAAHTIGRLVELRESQVDKSNLERCIQLLEWFTTDKLPSCLLYIGRLEDQDLHQELLQAVKLTTKSADQIYKFSNGEGSVESDLLAAVQKVKNLDPSSSIKDVSRSVSLSYTLHSIIAFDAVLHPTSNLENVSSQLSTLQTVREIPTCTLLSEILRCCLLSMNEQDGFEVLKWDAFTLIKLPKLFHLLLLEGVGRQSESKGEGEVFEGLRQLLQYPALLDITDSRCRANTFELILKSMGSGKHQLLKDEEAQQLLAARSRQTEGWKPTDIKLSDGNRDSMHKRDVSLILKAEATIDTIIKTFENRTTDQTEFEPLLSIMFRIIKGSSFDLLLCAGATNGTLEDLVTKLLIFNEGCKESMGESVRGSQNRAALFDMTFLMLVYTVQCFGSEVVLRNAESGFFVTWARECMSEPGKVKPISAFQDQESQVDGLLQQIITGEIRTQVIKWQNVCNNIHGVMREILLGCEMGAVNTETYNKLTAQLCSKLCCLPVCIVSWLASHTQYGHQVPGQSSVTPVQVLDRFVGIATESEDAESLPHYAQRCAMMVNIIKRMKNELEPKSWALEQKDLKTAQVDRTEFQGLSLELTALWDDAWSRGRLGLQSTRKLAELSATGGSVWFVEVLVGKLFSQVYKQDMDRTVEMVLSLMHNDLAANTLALVLSVLPRLLCGPGQEERLTHPSGPALAKLTVLSLAAALRPGRGGANKRSARAAQLDDLCDDVATPLKLRRLGLLDTESSHGERQDCLEQAHVGLFHLLANIGTEPGLSPRTEWVCSFLEQCVVEGGDQTCRLLKPLQPSLLLQLVKLQPHRFSMELILRLNDVNSPTGRKNLAKILCLVRNVQAKKALPANS